MSTLSVGDLQGLAVNSNVVTVPTGHTLNVTDAAGLQIGGTAIGDWTDHSASQAFTGFTKGNATIESYYTQVNDIVFYRGWVQLGSTSSMTGPLDLTAPVPTAEGAIKFWGGTSTFRTPNTHGNCLLIGANTFRLILFVASGTYVTPTDISTTVPFTWTTGSQFSWDLVYRTA